MVVGTVAVILICCIALFLDRYRSAMVQSAQTSSAQAVSQVSNTVGSYLSDMDQAMRLVEQSVSESGESRDRLLAAFLKFRPDVVAVTSYSADGELLDCWSPDREPKENILQNLSFDLDMARATGGSFMTAPHVETIFEGYYPWVVTMTAPLEGGGEAAWVSLDLSFSGISSYIKNVSIGQRGYCFLMDDAGNIIYHPQQQLLYAGLKSEDTEALAALEPPEEAHTPQEALETLRVLFRRSRGAYWACAALAGLCALAALLALAGPRGSRLWPFLASAGVGLAAAAMLLYLAWMGRLPARAAMTVLLPAVALALWLVLHGAAGLWTSGSGPRRAAAVAAVLVGAAMLAPCARAAYHSTYNPDPAQGESACTRLERYALAHGDRLFIADLSLGDDRSLFPDWSAGKPSNLLLAWGGWNNHSEGYCAAFARFGYAHDGFRIADFADSPLRLVTGAGAQPSDAFMACLNRQLGRPVTAVLEAEEGGFAVYAFTTETADKGDGNP